MTGCVDGWSDKKLENHIASLSIIKQNMIDKMTTLESDSQYNENVLSCYELHPTDKSHEACQRKRDHKGKHYCISCGESWNTKEDGGKP